MGLLVIVKAFTFWKCLRTQVTRCLFWHTQLSLPLFLIDLFICRKKNKKVKLGKCRVPKNSYFFRNEKAVLCVCFILTKLFLCIHANYMFFCSPPVEGLRTLARMIEGRKIRTQQSVLRVKMLYQNVSRNTRERWSLDLGVFWQVALEVGLIWLLILILFQNSSLWSSLPHQYFPQKGRACSASSPASICTRRLIWGHRPTMFPPKRYKWCWRWNAKVRRLFLFFLCFRFWQRIASQCLLMQSCTTRWTDMIVTIICQSTLSKYLVD